MTDNRFSALSKDPRYRLPSRKEARTAVDPRFGRLFTDQDFRKKASVDRYGRKIRPEAGDKELERVYRLDDNRKAGKVALEEDEEDEEEQDDLIQDAILARLQSGKRDLAREGGFSDSSSDEDNISGEESEDEADLAVETAGHEHAEDVPMGEASRRIAAVNLDWDNIRASDIMAVGSSFAPTSGRILRVSIYPSDFGRDRLQQEELNGPPREIFASSKRNVAGPLRAQDGDEEDEDEDEDESDENDERIRKQLQQDQTAEGNDFDTAKLREYQLARLRYYYAVIECGDTQTAKALYDAMDGREYLSSANFFDLRFIPDSVSFDDDKPRDECTRIAADYRPNEFRTEALTHSKVRLTWDDDDTTRKEVQKRAFSRAEIDENDLQAYIGSDSSDAESVASRKSVAESRNATRKEIQKQKMRAALGLGDEPRKSKMDKAEPVGDMQITFTSGFGTNKESKGVFENEPQDEESTRARYIRKERERKQKRKEKMKDSRPGVTDSVGEDDNAQRAETRVELPDTAADEDPFNDPFFTDPGSAAAAEKQMKKAERQQRREAKAAKEQEVAERRAELELLMADDRESGVRHFDMRQVEKAEKEARRKGKNKKKRGMARDQDIDAGGVEGTAFQIETKDPRFKALFESHEYAIDPTNPRFKGTQAMNALLDEGRKKRKRVDGSNKSPGEGAGTGHTADKVTAHAGAQGGEDLNGLVARLKKKSKDR